MAKPWLQDIGNGYLMSPCLSLCTLMLYRVSVETPFHMATLQSLLQLLGSLAEDELQQQQQQEEQRLEGLWEDQHLKHQEQYLYVSSDPNIYSLSFCQDPPNSHSAPTQQQQQPVEKDKQDNPHPTRDLLLQLQSFCNPAAPPPAAAASKHKAASSSMQQVNSLTAKCIASHDAQLLKAGISHKEQSSKKQKRKQKKKHGQQLQSQQQQQQALGGRAPVKLQPESFALLHHLKLSLGGLIQQHMLELAR